MEKILARLQNLETVEDEKFFLLTAKHVVNLEENKCSCIAKVIAYCTVNV